MYQYIYNLHLFPYIALQREQQGRTYQDRQTGDEQEAGKNSEKYRPEVNRTDHIPPCILHSLICRVAWAAILNAPEAAGNGRQELFLQFIRSRSEQHGTAQLIEYGIPIGSPSVEDMICPCEPISVAFES